jgi:DnaK suppressor protein
MQQQRMIAANRDAARQRRRQTEAALARCEADEYGDCSGCGEPIGYARLKARPESPLCVRCQSSREDAR